MPASRDRLHLSKLDEFAQFAETRGYVREETRGEYQVLRIRRGTEKPIVYFHRTGCEHATVPLSPRAAWTLVRDYLRAKRSAKT